jgi:quinol monooxygenase YgiN
MSVVVVATIVPVLKHRADVIAAFEKVVARVHAEDDGCELYALNEGPDRLVMVEKWSSAEALDAHGKGPALAELGSALAGKTVGDIDVQVLQPHPAGTPQQGTV